MTLYVQCHVQLHELLLRCLAKSNLLEFNVTFIYWFKGETLNINWKLKWNKKMLDKSNNIDIDQEYSGSSVLWPSGRSK